MLDEDEDKDYTKMVRKSLFNKRVQKKAASSGLRKIKVNFDEYKSENVFEEATQFEVHQKKKQNKIRKSKRDKSKSSYSPDEDFSCSVKHFSEKMRETIPRKMKSKKPLILDSFRTESYIDNMDLMSPSKSEIDNIPFLAKKDSDMKIVAREQSCSIYVSSSDEDSNSDFDFNSFFSSSEPSMNESTNAQYSALNYRIINKNMKNISINSSQIYSDSEDESYLNRTDVSNKQIESEHTSKLEKTVENETNVNGDESESNCLESSILTGDSEEKINIISVYKSCAKYYTEGNEKFVIINRHCSISVFGVFKLKVIEGKIDVHGYILDKVSKEITLYSPRGSALINLKNIANNDCVLRYSELMDTKLPFIERHISQQIFPRAIDNLPRVTFEPKDISCVFNVDNSWHHILETLNQSSKLLITGGKGVGKSTFLRYALNKLLNQFEKVRVIDLDTGQSEFTVPGCVSVLTVTEPLFGPNYTHLMKTERSYLSNINIGHDPLAYIKCVQMLVSYIQTLDDIPTLINYMGFVQGIGLNILSSVITYLKPTDIVQIISKNKRKNFRMDLSVRVVQEHCKLFGWCSKHIDFKVHKLKALNDENEGWTLEPRQAREMCVLAYFGKMMTENIHSLSSHMLPMYEIDLGSIKLVNLQGTDLLPAAVNANLVAMCSLEENSNIFSCFGYGIVRGIDLNSGTLILLTPEDQSVLENVFYLVLGSVMLPPSVYMTSNGIIGNIPYVMEGELFSLAQITKRTYLPVNRNKI